MIPLHIRLIYKWFLKDKWSMDMAAWAFRRNEEVRRSATLDTTFMQPESYKALKLLNTYEKKGRK